MSIRSRLFVLIFFGSVLALTANVSAQQPKVLAPHKPVPPRAARQIKWLTPATQRSMVGGLWMTSNDYKSSIYLKNIVETDPVTVTPILHLSNGAKYILPEITVQPADLAIININDELQKKGISSWATLSGYVELQYLWPWDPFCATIRDVDLAHSLIFTYSLRPTMPLPVHLAKPIHPPATNIAEGMWWKHEKNISGFVAIANLASQPAQATVQITDDRGLPISQHTVSVSPQGMKLIQLPELQTTEALQGGVRIMSSETTDQLVINGGLQDQAIGFSAGMPFATEPVGSTPEHRTIAELGLMAGAADPMMQFPAGTTFTPYSVLRNVSDAPLSVTPTLWWMEGGKPHSAPLPQVTLPPFQTQRMDLTSQLPLFGPKNFNGNFSISLETQAPRASLVMSSGSVDQTGNYVFEVIPRGVSEGASKSLQQWSTGNGDDTMFTIWNPADEAQDFVFTLFFPGGHYLLPLHMEARDLRTFNISEVLMNQLPDAEGNLVPPSIHQGTAKISGSLGETQHILVAVDFGVYNVRKATCGNGCTNCLGYTSYVVDLPEFGVAVNGTQQESAMADWSGGGQYNLAGSSTWTSSQTSVMTVSAGLATGKAVGSVEITATGYEPYPMVACEDADCGDTDFENDAGGTTQPTITGGNTVWWFNGQNPNSASYPISVTLTSSAGSSTSWTVSQADTKVNLSPTSGAQTTITSTGTHFSSQVGDISITATANGAASAPFTMTTRTPWKLVSIGKNTACYSSPETYTTTVSYDVQDNLSTTISSDIYWNESLGSAVCDNSSNWCKTSFSPGGGDSNPLQDLLSPPYLNANPAPSPQPTCSGQGTGTIPYRSIPQVINVGGSDTGQGVQAQSDTIDYYIDHAQHDSIVVPSQPPQ